jgi:tetratricopeptide (TPR) repeat protein
MTDYYIFRKKPCFFNSGFFSRKIFSLIFLFIFLPVNSNSATDVKGPDEYGLINNFFRNLYNFSFDAADSIIMIMQDSNIDDATMANIKANLSWWKLLCGDETGTNFKACNVNLDASIRSTLGNKHPDINSLFNIIYSYSLKARLENYRGNTIKAFIYFYKSLTFIEKCIDAPVRDEKLNLVLGMYYYFIDYAEDKYFMLNALFLAFPKGDKNKGLKYLELCSVSNDDMIRTEANYFLLKIYANTEKDYSKALSYSQVLTREHPNNLVYCLEQFKLLLKMEKTTEAKAFEKELIEEIEIAKNINSVQKNHFLSQIGSLAKEPDYK